MGQKIKSTAAKGLNMYLKGTQKLADKIESALPESMTKPSPRSGGRGRGRRGYRSSRTGRGGTRGMD